MHPILISANVAFLRQVLSNEKVLIPLNQVKHHSVPVYQEVSFEKASNAICL